MHVFITGGTGLVGHRIATMLRDRDDQVTILSRSQKANPNLPQGTKIVSGDPAVKGPWLDAMLQCDAVIHLAGASIAEGRWNAENKAKILNSRVDSTRLIAEAIATQKQIPLLCASAVGYYGAYLDNATEFTEKDLPGNDFLANVCVKWEKACQPARDAGARFANFRLGIVLAKNGGALPQLVKPFKWFVGGVVGSGKQWMSWIHLDDLARLFLHVLDHRDLAGPINAVAPEPVTNWGFSHLLARVLDRPCLMPVPSSVLRLLLGEKAVLATHGQRVSAKLAEKSGFEFQYGLLENALKELLLSK